MKENNSIQQKIFVTIKDRTKMQYNSEATSVTSVNSGGVFDVLPQHSNFISLIKNYVIVNAGTKEELKFKIDKGIMYVMESKVTVYVGI